MAQITGVRLPPELRAKIQQQADGDGRKLSQQIIRMLQEQIARHPATT